MNIQTLLAIGVAVVGCFLVWRFRIKSDPNQLSSKTVPRLGYNGICLDCQERDLDRQERVVFTIHGTCSVCGSSAVASRLKAVV